MLAPDIRHAATVAGAIASDFYDDRLALSAREVAPGSTWLRMPEVECVARLRASGVSDRTVRLFLTFIAAMDRARDATRLWNNGVKLYQAYPELFEPAEASATPISTLRERLSHYGVSQRHGPDSSAWNVIAHSLAAGGNPVSRVLESGVGNAGELLSYLRTSSGGAVPLSPTQGFKDWANVAADACCSRRGQNRQHRYRPRRGRRARTPRYREPWSLGYSGCIGRTG